MNKEDRMEITTTAITAIIMIIVGIGTTIYNICRPKKIKDETNGFYVTTKRKLKKNELREFNERRTNGETAFSILDNMNLIRDYTDKID